MQTIASISCTLLLAAAATLHGADAPADPFRTVEGLAKFSSHDARYAERLNICFVNPAEQPNRYTPPQYLESDYDFRIGFGDERSSQLIREMLEAKDASQMVEVDEPAAWRVAVIVEGPWTKRYLTLFANKEGDHALINGHTYAIHGALQTWLRTRVWAVYNATSRSGGQSNSEKR